MDISKLVDTQRAFFMSGATLDCDYRANALDALYKSISEKSDDLLDALKADLNKPRFEGYMSEIGIVLDEIRYARKHLAAWMRPKRVRTPVAQFKSKSFVAKEPLGVSLVMSPWNYPVQLALTPLIGAVAAGCTCIIKPSAYAPNCSRAVRVLIESTFPEEYIAVKEGGRAENTALLEQKFDFIFFTGSTDVGKLVMEQAAKHLTPVLLELGGKSPCIVDASADIPLAAKRIAFGKLINAGQTCVAPDYVLVHESVKESFTSEYKKAVDAFFPGGFSDFTSIINKKHFERVLSLIDDEKIVFGGKSDKEKLFIEPTLMAGVTWEDAVMQEEVFGPVMPILTFSSINEPIAQINAHARPLALYIFTNDRENEREVLKRCRFGGGCVNDTVIHLATHEMGFGGVGESGMGAYHGKKSFDAFTHEKSILKKSNKIDLPMRYRPYTEGAEKLIRRFLK